MSTVPGLVRKALSDSLYGAAKRSYDKVFGHTKEPTYQQLLEMYSRRGVSKRVVNAPADAIWSSPPTITASDEFMDGWKDLVVRHKVYHKLHRLDKLAGIGKFALLVVGFKDGGSLASELQEGRGKELLYLQPYSEGCVEVDEYDSDPTSARYGMPKVYSIDPSKLADNNDKALKKFQKFKVHASRCIHVAEDVLENDVYGNSRLRAVYNLLEDLHKVTGGSAEGFWLTANRGLHIDVDKDLDLTPEDEAALADEIEEYENQLTRAIRTRGVKVKSLGGESLDPSGAFNALLSLISGTTGIPKRILLGAEAGQLASDQDRANWADRIDERRELFVEPTIFFPFIKLMVYAGVLPVTDITIAWAEAFKMSPLERSQTSAQTARSAANVAKAMSVWNDMKNDEESDITEDLITVDEGRAILGFRQDSPIFDDAGDTDLDPV